MTVPRPPAFDADSFDNALDTRVRKGPSTVTIDGTPHDVVESPIHYPAIQKFAPWKRWVDGLRSHIEALRIGVFGPDGVKKHTDRNTARIEVLEEDVRVLKEAPAPRPFP